MLMFVMIKLKKKSLFFLSIPLTLFIYSNVSAIEEQKFIPVQPMGVFSTLSAYTVEKDSIAAIMLVERCFKPDFNRITFALEYGITENIDILLNIPYAIDYSNIDGFQDISIGFKHKLILEEQISPSLTYIAGFTFTGKEDISTGGSIGGGILVSKKVGPFLGNFNIFYFKPIETKLKDEIELRIGLDLAAAHDFNILTEMIVKKSHYSENIDLLEGRFGYRVKLSVSSYATVGIGYDFKNREPAWRLFLNFNIFYPSIHKKIRKIYYEE